jgi:dihydropyrimidinase
VTDLIVAGGTVVTPQGSIDADVAVSDGRITAVGTQLPRSETATVIDATGLLVLPGVVDVHTHLRLEDEEHPRRFHRDTLAAARGGTTTIVSFNNPGTGISEAGAESLLRGVAEFRERTEERSAIDYAVSAVLGGHQPDPIEELPELIRSGVPTFKAFMVYDFRLPDETIEQAMRVAAAHGGMLLVHCEAPDIIDPLVDEAVGRHQLAARYHALTRPPRAEAIATRRAIEMARRAEAPLYIVHLSSAEALDEVADAKSRGEPVYAETCPHYLALSDDLYGHPDEGEVLKRIISPPLRSQADVDALWVGVRDGIVDVVASDHVPDRLDTEKALPAPPFPKISNGAPGIETLLAVVYSEGVAGRRIDVGRMVEVLSSTPARLFGLASKGAIEPGMDADIVLLDPSARRTISQADLSHSSDFTPYEGLLVNGAINGVLVRGRPIGEQPGRFLERRLA